MTTLTPALRLPALGVAPAVRREAATQAFARTLAPEDVVTGWFEPRASRAATAFLSIRHVIDASCISPIGIGDAKQIGSG